MDLITAHVCGTAVALLLGMNTSKARRKTSKGGKAMDDKKAMHRPALGMWKKVASVLSGLLVLAADGGTRAESNDFDPAKALCAKAELLVPEIGTMRGIVEGAFLRAVCKEQLDKAPATPYDADTHIIPDPAALRVKANPRTSPLDTAKGILFDPPGIRVISTCVGDPGLVGNMPRHCGVGLEFFLPKKRQKVLLGPALGLHSDFGGENLQLPRLLIMTE